MDMPFMNLPARLVDAADLAQSLVARRGAALELRAGRVEQVNTAALQVLLSAAATWRNDGHGLHIAQPSPAFDNALTVLGIPPHALANQGECR